MGLADNSEFLPVVDTSFLDDLVLGQATTPQLLLPEINYNESNTIGLPLVTIPMLKGLESPRCDSQSPTALSGSQFDMLSQLNVEIHKGWDSMSRFGKNMTFIEFVCTNTGYLQGFRSIQDLIKNTQEYLAIIKALHHQIGTKSLPQRTHPMITQNLLGSTNLPHSPGNGSFPNLASFTENPTQHRIEPPSHDSPTMFLVVSCYIQLIKHLEQLLQIIHDFVADTSQILLPATEIDFSNTKILEAAPQYIMFLELMKNIFGQIHLVLGLPSTWSRRTAWTGLLKSQKYQEMVNQELGAVEGQWTTRPAGLIHMLGVTKEMFVEYSMLGY